MGIVAVNYTPGQLRNAVGIGQETYRHWKKALAPFRREAGHSPCFTAGDLLAAAIIKVLVAEFGIRVSALSSLAGTIFAECNERSWPTLERSLMVIELIGTVVVVQPEGSGLAIDRPAMVVPLRVLTEGLRRTLLAGDDDGQETLRFPPVAQPAVSSQRKANQA
jgi:hypothetical protein